MKKPFQSGDPSATLSAERRMSGTLSTASDKGQVKAAEYAALHTLRD